MSLTTLSGVSLWSNILPGSPAGEILHGYHVTYDIRKGPRGHLCLLVILAFEQLFLTRHGAKYYFDFTFVCVNAPLFGWLLVLKRERLKK